MGQYVLIAEARAIVRAGLHAIFAQDGRVSDVDDVHTVADLLIALAQHEPDLLLINQNLIEAMEAMPAGHFAVLAIEPNLAFLRAAHACGARGYISEQASPELLHVLLRPTAGTFILDPNFSPWLLQHLPDTLFTYREPADTVLTPREHQVAELLRAGVNRQTIARQLCITESTLKTHMKHIARKQRELRQTCQDSMAVAVAEAEGGSPF